MANRLRYCILLLFASVAFVSCIYEDFDMECEYGVPAAITDGYSLALNVTLDKMGGMSATRAEANPMEEVEDYVNPEKFRVLFFDSQYRFLFESKSRWVKLLSQDADKTSWFVSIPIFSYGNDVKYDWPWEQIRGALTTTEKNIDPQKDCFYIAILANRPTMECFPDLDGVFKQSRTFDNSGPHWFLENTAGYTGDNGDVKSVFDLHHCQWDPIYTSKSHPDLKNNNYHGFYEIIMGLAPGVNSNNITNDNRKKDMQMSATSCWVDHGATLSDDGIKDGLDNRKAIHPSKDYPIPMYGIQRFTKIPADAWTKGTPFNLSVIPHVENKNGAYKDYTANISLLRSVVKLELRIPKKYQRPTYVGLTYSNIYARCEPMDVWTPTDKLWKNHNNGCEWETIWQHELLSQTQSDSGTTKIGFWNRLGWFYGAWLDTNPATGQPWWNFNTDKSLSLDNGTRFNPSSISRVNNPRIFNPCTQRNQRVGCTDAIVEDNDYYYYVVYTGERNVNDPSNLRNMNSHGTTVYWLVSFNADDSRRTPQSTTVTRSWKFSDWENLLRSSAPTATANTTNFNVTMNGLTYTSGGSNGKWGSDSDGVFIQPNGAGSKTSRVFSFSSPAAGTLRIKAKSADGSSRSMTVEASGTSMSSQSVTTLSTRTFKIDAGGTVSIYPNAGIRFYEIEYEFTTDQGTAFCIPIGDYSAGSGANNPLIQYAQTEYTPFYTPDKNNNNLDNTNEFFQSTYQLDVQNGYIDKKFRPYPLLRNHVYTLTLGSTTGDYSTRAGETNFTITSEERHSPTIKFD